MRSSNGRSMTLLLKKIHMDTGVEAGKLSTATQEVLWSTAVQHGKNTTVIRKAVKRMEESDSFKLGDDGLDRKSVV